MNNGLLQVEELRLHYRTTQGVVQAVDGVTFSLAPRQALAVLGESGCGKSSLARAILRLLPRNVEVYDGCVRVNGLDVMPWTRSSSGATCAGARSPLSCKLP